MKVIFCVDLYLVNRDAERNEKGLYKNTDLDKGRTLSMRSENVPDGYPKKGQRFCFRDSKGIQSDPDLFIVDLILPTQEFAKNEWWMIIYFKSIFLEYNERDQVDYFKELGWK